MRASDLTTAREKAVSLRELHRGLLVLPNAWDAASARLFESTGFPAVGTTSAGIAFSLGLPDGERLQREAMLARVAEIARRIAVPVSADLEAGYGGTPEEVGETVRRAIEAGAVGINLEDGDPRRDGALIEVAGFAASTLNISDADWIAGRLRFAGTGAEGKLTNAGTIKTAEGGYVYLIAPAVENQAGAVITSPKGEIVIAAGKTVELVNALTPDLRVEYTAPDNQAVNAGEVVASSGRVGIYGTLIRNSGAVSANRAEVGDGGRVVLRAVKDVTQAAERRQDAACG